MTLDAARAIARRGAIASTGRRMSALRAVASSGIQPAFPWSGSAYAALTLALKPGSDAFRIRPPAAGSTSSGLDSISVPAGAGLGDFLLALAMSPIDDLPAGWEIAVSRTVDGLGQDMYLAYRFMQPGDTTFDFPSYPTNSGNSVTMLALTGVDTSSPIEASAAADHADSPSVTTTSENCYLIAAKTQYFSGGTVAPGSASGPYVRPALQLSAGIAGLQIECRSWDDLSAA